MTSSLIGIKSATVVWIGSGAGSTDLVHVEEGEEFMDFLRLDQGLRGHVPVGSGHLIPHLIHSSRSGSDPDAAGLMEPHRLQEGRRRSEARPQSGASDPLKDEQTALTCPVSASRDSYSLMLSKWTFFRLMPGW